MLTAKQIKELPIGEFPNHKLFGPNSYRTETKVNEITKVKEKKTVPTYDNRRQIRRAKYTKISKSHKRQVIFLAKVALEDMEANVITSSNDCYDNNGHLKPRYRRIVYHLKQ